MALMCSLPQNMYTLFRSPGKCTVTAFIPRAPLLLLKWQEWGEQHRTGLLMSGSFIMRWKHQTCFFSATSCTSHNSIVDDLNFYTTDIIGSSRSHRNFVKMFTAASKFIALESTTQNTTELGTYMALLCSLIKVMYKSSCHGLTFRKQHTSLHSHSWRRSCTYRPHKSSQ